MQPHPNRSRFALTSSDICGRLPLLPDAEVNLGAAYSLARGMPSEDGGCYERDLRTAQAARACGRRSSAAGGEPDGGGTDLSPMLKPTSGNQLHLLGDTHGLRSELDPTNRHEHHSVADARLVDSTANGRERRSVGEGYAPTTKWHS
jgi:hypothetical protein